MSMKKLLSSLLAVGMLTGMIPTALMEQEVGFPEDQTAIVVQAPGEEENLGETEDVASGDVEDRVPEEEAVLLGGGEEADAAPLPAGEMQTGGEDDAALPGETGELPVEENASARSDFEIDDKGVVTRYVGNGGEVIVPDDVTGIGDNAFAYSSVTSVILPKNVASIGAHTFSSCESLTKVDLPDTLTSIGAYAFSNCYNLTLKLPAGLTAIGEKAFTGIDSLGEVTIPAAMTTVPAYAFAGSYISKLTIQEGVTAIAAHAFEEARGDFSLSLPKTVTKIGDYAFKKSGVSELVLVDGLKEIGAHAFEECANSLYIVAPASLTSIGDYAFYNARVSSDAFPEGLSEIGAHAFETTFWYGGSMWNVSLPKGISAIGESAFQNCGAYEIEIKGNVGKMGKRAFSDNKKLSNVKLASDFNALSAGIFAGCTDLEEIELSMSLTSVPSAAFSGCTSLDRVIFKGGVSEIADEAFLGCTALGSSDPQGSIDLPDSLKTIGEAAFSGCANLGAIELPEKVTSIGKSAFKDCAALSSFEFNKKLSSIGALAFDGCASLTSVDLPESLTTVGKQAFENCTGLECFTLTNKTTEIGERAFYGCANLAEVLIPATVKTIGSKAFDNCPNLKILCENDSAAEKYAKDNGINYDTTGVEQQITVELIPGKNPVKEYDGTTKVEMKPEAFRVNGLRPGDGDKVTITDVTVEFEKADVGVQNVKAKVDVTISTGQTTVYKLKDDIITFEGSITQKTVSVIPDADQGKGVGSADPELTYKCEGLIGDDKFTGKLGREPGEVVGTYKYTVGTLSHQNYKPEIKGEAVFTIRDVDFSVKVESVNFTGSAVTPMVTVTDTSTKKVLTVNIDYTLRYEDNVNVGTGKVTVTGMGDYKGVSKTANFQIVRGFTWDTIGAQAYRNGAAVEPAVVVRDLVTKTVLTKDVDYTLTFSNNTQVGTGTVKITGKGNYNGTTDLPFRISRPFTVSLAQTIYTYTGLAIRPVPTVKDGATTLPATQYTLTYANNILEGSGTVTATGAKGTDYEDYEARATFIIQGNSAVIPDIPTAEDVELDKSMKLTVYVGDTFNVYTTDYEAVKYKSSKSSVATVDESGDVECLKEGKAKITVTLDNKKKRTLTLTVEDPEKPTKLYFIDKYPTIDVEDGELDLLENLVIEPETAADAELEWKSSDKKVLEVDKETGTLTPHKEGKATITVTAKNGKKSAKIKVKVTNMNAPKKLYFDEGSSIEVYLSDGTYELAVIAETESGEEAVSEYKWSSSKTSVATVDKEETGDTVSVELKKKGSAKITVKSDNGKKASIKIKVIDDEDD